MGQTNWVPFVWNTVVATVILAGLYGLTYGIQFRPLQMPGYILLMGFGTFGGAAGPETVFPVVFSIYLVFLGAVGAAAVHVVRRRLFENHFSGWRFGIAGALRLGIAGALGITGVLSILFATVALSDTQMDAVFTTVVSALVFLGLAGWFAGLVTIRTKWSENADQ